MNREEEVAMVERLLKKQNMTKYRLAVEAGIPHATLNDICSGKTRLEKCSAELQRREAYITVLRGGTARHRLLATAAGTRA